MGKLNVDVLDLFIESSFSLILKAAIHKYFSKVYLPTLYQ